MEHIRVPETLEGNAYVNVSFVRALDSKEIFMSPLSYAVKSFTVSHERRTNPLTIKIPEKLRPGEKLEIQYSSAYPAKIVLYAVDEGILRVARYQNPDPIASFFEKRALEVETSQILDLILPEYSIMNQLSAFGGGEDLDLGQNLNPFKRKRKAPVAFWSTIVESDSTARSVSYPVPDYFSGSIRVIAVAVSEDRIGTFHGSTQVKGDFVITPHLPLFLAPGDEARISATITNTLAGSGQAVKIDARLKVTPGIEILEDPLAELTIDEGSEKTTHFRVRATSKLGNAAFTFVATTGAGHATLEETLSVRPASAFITRIAGGYVSDGSASLPVTRELYPEYHTQEAAASTVPLGLAKGLMLYLDNYPYACTEQLVSKAFPAIVLAKRPEFGFTQQSSYGAMQGILSVLRARQNADGAFGYWAANSHASEFVSVYAAHFLTEAAERGFSVAQSLRDNALRYLRTVAAHNEGLGVDPNVRAYAIYVLTRNGVITTSNILDLRQTLEADQPETWRKGLAALYLAASYQLLKEVNEAKSLVRNVEIAPVSPDGFDGFFDRSARNAQYLYILARHFPQLLPALPPENILAIVEPLQRGEQNSLSAAYAVLAFDTYVDAVGTPKTNKLEVSFQNRDRKLVPAEVSGKLFPTFPVDEQAQAIVFQSESSTPVFYQLTEAGFDKTMPASEIHDKLEVVREYLDVNFAPISEAQLGDDIYVNVRVRAIGSYNFQNVAIVDLLPAGFEAELQSTSGASRRSETMEVYTWTPDYVDIREDRVLMFGTVDQKVKEYVYRVRAKTEGSFTVPPLFAESMYNRRVQARSLGGHFAVKGQ